MKPKLTIIRGLPGSGKSTIAGLIDSGYVEADQFFVKDGVYCFNAALLSEAHQWCQAEVDNLLSLGKNAVVANTFTTLHELRPYFVMAKKYGITPSVILAQGNFGSVHAVPKETIERMRARFVFDLTPLYC